MKVNYQLHMVAGNLTDDVKSTDKYASFTVAVDVGFGERKTTHFFNATAFPSTFSEKMWNVVTTLKKGTNVMIEYQESDGSYEKEGVKIRAVKRIISKLSPIFGDKPVVGNEEVSEVTAPKANKTTAKAVSVDVGDTDEDDSIPF